MIDTSITLYLNDLADLRTKGQILERLHPDFCFYQNSILRILWQHMFLLRLFTPEERYSIHDNQIQSLNWHLYKLQSVDKKMVDVR